MQRTVSSYLALVLMTATASVSAVPVVSPAFLCVLPSDSGLIRFLFAQLNNEVLLAPLVVLVLLGSEGSGGGCGMGTCRLSDCVMEFARPLKGCPPPSHGTESGLIL